MESAIKQLEYLVAMGESFTYDNFSEKSGGYTSILSPDWIMWTVRSAEVVEQYFGSDSTYAKLIIEALNIKLIDQASISFTKCRNNILGGLKGALDAARHNYIKEDNIPTTSVAKTNNKVFIVHGHDETAKTALEIFLADLGLEPIVLHRQPDEGQTIIEKFEKHSDVGYAFILLTPDEVAFLKKEELLPPKERNQEFRARPNVIFEFGFFVGRLGRSRVCCLHTGGVALPSDMSGFVYKSYSEKIKEAAEAIILDLKACGYELKSNQ